jgi:hypothetical protein
MYCLRQAYVIRVSSGRRVHNHRYCMMQRRIVTRYPLPSPRRERTKKLNRELVEDGAHKPVSLMLLERDLSFSASLINESNNVLRSGRFILPKEPLIPAMPNFKELLSSSMNAPFPARF